MIITSAITKKVLETIIHESFSTFGSLSSSFLLDSLKFLGFYYATNAGVSINVEDLKTPHIKEEIIMNASNQMSQVSSDWERGFISDIERFQSIIDNWNGATESLKNRIIHHYKKFDPVNNLYIMAFSGARGNMSQVRQLVGMRGLMSDQEGNIIDLPIQANFREGLSSIDYIISSYGARKGIVDTALKTADSGYLTRRLIYVAQDLIIREIDCFTKTGIIILLSKNNNVNNILGRFLLATNPPEFLPSNSILDKEKLKSLKTLSLQEKTEASVTIRSPLTCNSSASICQKCYGWDLARNKLISLGEAVGIIAAQSIGEPGTQLTMRTFHTGGIFTSELLQQKLAPFSGKIEIPISLKSIPYRTTHGVIVARLQQETKLIMTNWKGIKKEILLERGSFLYQTSSAFIKKGQLISEYSARSVLSGTRRLKPIYTSLEGELKFESLCVRLIERAGSAKLKVNEDDGVLWLTAGKIFPLPEEASYEFSGKLRNYKAMAKLKFVSPFSGIFTLKNNIATITKAKGNQFEIDFSAFIKEIPNTTLKLAILTKNYQYIDAFTTIGFLYIFPKCFGKIYFIRKNNKTEELFIVTESDVWQINSDQVSNFEIFPKKKTLIKAGSFLNQTSEVKESGFFLKKDGFKMIFQKAIPIFLTRGAILNYTQGAFIFKNKVLATLVNYQQQTEDIVQGLPKIEELIEARTPKIKCYLAKRPGVFLNATSELKAHSKDDIINFTSTANILNRPFITITSNSKTGEKIQSIGIAHSIFYKETVILYKNSLYRVKPILSHRFQDFMIDMLGGYEKYKKFMASMEKKTFKPRWTFKRVNSTLIKWKQIKHLGFYKNKNWKGCVVKTLDEKFLFLAKIEPISHYLLPLTTKILFKPGNFVDLGEPISDGTINPHELLSIFFNYHSVLDGIMKGTIRSLNKFQLILVNSIQSIYQSQGVNISNKHIEIIARQLTSKVIIKESGSTPLLPSEIIRLSLVIEICKSLKNSSHLEELPKYEPRFLSTTSIALGKEGFLSPAGFQETKRVLMKAAIEGKCDWLKGLKESIIIGRIIPAGSTFLNYKSYLDNIHLYKKKSKKN